MPTSYQQWVWERDAHIYWSMVTCQGSTRLEVPRGLLDLCRRILNNNSAIDRYTMRAYSLEHKQCCKIVIYNEEYIYIYFYNNSAKTFYYVHEIVS